MAGKKRSGGSSKNKTVKVVKESPTGRNEKFQEGNKPPMTRPQFVKKIKQGQYPDYHVRKVGGVDTPVSNPDNSGKNNLDQ